MARASSPVVAVCLLVAVTVLAAAAVGTTLATETPSEPVAVTDLRVSADAATDSVTLRHAGGETLNASSLRVRLRVDGQPLAHQPPVPFFATRGFRSGPTGPFNPAGGTTWRAGQRATLRLASTNSPRLRAGDRVVVTVATDQGIVAELSTTAT